jgi:pSer/pThr/pTyr-binding forkhead associated (FHA) protein
MATPDETFHLMLRIEGPGQKTRVEDLVRDRYTIGRGDPSGAVKADFTIAADTALSRAHCRLHKTGPTYAVENLSPNGTLVNGKAIDKIVPLKHRDKITLGEQTVLEFLAVTDDERLRELEAAASGKTAKQAAAKGKKPFWQRPLFLGVMAVYAIVGLLFLFGGDDEKAHVPDPGGGPYFGWMRRAPLLYDTDPEKQRKFTAAMWKDVTTTMVPEALRDAIASTAWDAARLREKIPQEQRRALAAREWQQALLEHGGDVAVAGAHAYYLLNSALRVLGLEGYMTFEAALEKNDEVATVAVKVLDALEARLAALHDEADRYWTSKHWKLAREKYERILDAIPSSHEPLQLFAADRYARLAKMKSR